MNFTWEELFVEDGLPDKRLRKRACKIARASVERPGAAMTSAFDVWGDTRTAYNFFANERVSFAVVLESPMTVVSRALREQFEGTTVLNVQDTTEINLSHLNSMTGLGEIGNPKNRGIFLHPSLAVSPDGVPIGLLSAQVWDRPPSSHGKAKKRKQNDFEDKESLRWWTAIEASEKRVARAGLLVHVGDRECDIYDVFKRARDKRYRILLRAAQDRRVEGEHSTLWAQVASFSPVGEARPLSVPMRPAKESKPARAARDTSIVIRYGLITLREPKGSGTVEMYAVQVTEVDPPSGVEPIEWLLLTSDPITSVEDAWQRVEWYRCRWRIEEFFQVLKSGCRIEARQFESRSTYEPSLAIALLTAVRLLSMVKQARATPDAPASAVLSQEEEHVLVQHAQAKKMGHHCDSSPLRLVDAVVLIAMLGGYKARSCDGPPGWITLWRGFRRLEDMVEGYRLAHPGQPVLSSQGSLRLEEPS
jgi:hypothetical protein